MPSEAQIIRKNNKKPIIHSSQLSRDEIKMNVYVQSRIQEWSNDSILWLKEVLRFRQLLKLSSLEKEFYPGEENPAQLLDQLSGVTIPQLYQSLKELMNELPIITSAKFEKVMDEYDQVKSQFSLTRSLVLTALIHSYPVTFR